MHFWVIYSMSQSCIWYSVPYVWIYTEYKPNIYRILTEYLLNIYLSSQFYRIWISHIFVRKENNICLQIFNIRLLIFEYSNYWIYLCYTVHICQWQINLDHIIIKVVWRPCTNNIIQKLKSGFCCAFISLVEFFLHYFDLQEPSDIQHKIILIWSYISSKY